MVVESASGDRRKRSQADLQIDCDDRGTCFPAPFQQCGSEMQPCGRGSNRSGPVCVHGLIPIRIFGMGVDVWGKWQDPDLLGPGTVEHSNQSFAGLQHAHDLDDRHLTVEQHGAWR